MFNTEKEPDRCLKGKGWFEGRTIIIINTPDVLHPDLSQLNLTKHVAECKHLADPGPHVFLLVLQPETFTVKHKQRLESILGDFSNRSFDHSLVLISAPKKKSSGSIDKYLQHPPFGEIIRKCQHSLLWQTNYDHQELSAAMAKIMEANNGDHVSRPGFENTVSDFPRQRFKQGDSVSLDSSAFGKSSLKYEAVCLWSRLSSN